MSEIAKFKFNFKTGEIEIEGSETFVKEQIAAVGDLVEMFATTSQKEDDQDDDEEEASGATTSTDSKKGADLAPTGTFGEWMHGFKSDLTEQDKALITARYVQAQSKTNDFKTYEVNKALKEHGIKLSNPSKELGRLATKKYMFQTRKVAKLKFMRISTDGQEYLASLRRGT